MNRYIFSNSKSVSKPNGFTMIEIIVTISIIAILLTIVGISLNGSQIKSRDSQRYSKVTVISEALEKYYQTNGSYPSCEELTKDPTTVSSTILKGLGADTLTAPGAQSGTNSISCSDTAINTYYYNSEKTDDGRGLDGRQYVLKYIKEATGQTETINSRYGITLLGNSTIHAIANNESQISLDWSAVDKATEYKVQRATDDQFKNNLYEETTKELSSVQDGLTTGTKYFFRVIGQSMNASSDWSDLAEAITVVLPPSSTDPVVTTNTVGSATTWSWTNATCAFGTSSRYVYRYTINNGFDSGAITTTDNSAAFTTAQEGYTYTVSVQAQCYTSMAQSSLSGTGSASYTRPMSAPVAPTIAVNYSNPNVVATVSATTCTETTANAQYAIRSRTNDGSWGAYSAWSTNLTASQTANQGVKYGYQVQARCHTAVNDSNVTVSAEATYIHPITAPSAPTVTVNTAGSTSTWSWSAPTCSTGTPNYQYRYTINSGYDSGLISTTVNSLPFTTAQEGYTYTVTVQSRCSNAFTNSAWTVAGSANYRRPYTYTLTTAAGTGGTVSGGGTYIENSVVTITATPNTGYSFSSWSGTGCSGTASHSITMTTSTSCTANFTINYYTVSVSTIGGGSVSGGGSIAYGSSTTITASAWTGYSFGSWSGTGCSGTASHSVTVTANMSCTANFTINSYSLSLSAGTGGTTSGAGTYTYGSTPTITATPSTGYLFSSWSGSSGCSGVSSHTITITGNLSCTATFVANNFTITLNTSGRGNYTFCANENGTCSFTGTSNVRYGAYSNWNYKYNVAGSTTCTNVNFGDPLPNYVKTCQYQAAVSVSGSGTYSGGTSHTITASPSGSFDSWTGGTGCSGTYSHSFTLNANTTCTANFSNHLVDSPTPPPAPSAPSLSASFVSNNAVLTVNAVSCSSGTAEYQIRYLRQKYTSDSSWTAWTAWSTTRSMTQTAQQGNKHNFEVIARCNNGGTYSLNSPTASTNIIMDIATPAAPTYTGPGSFSNGVYQVVNFTSYCPSNTDLVNGTFVSNLSSTGNIWGPHPFGFNDYWTNLEGYTLTATYWGTYQCQTSFKASPVSPQGVKQVPVYSG